MPDRQIIRCPSCNLNQFLTANGKCRKCQRNLQIEIFKTTEDSSYYIYPGKGRPRRVKGPKKLELSYSFRIAVKILRQAQGLSQRQLALRIGRPRTYISKLERTTCPYIQNIPEIAAGLMIPTWILIEFTQLIAKHVQN